MLQNKPTGPSAGRSAFRFPRFSRNGPCGGGGARCGARLAGAAPAAALWLASVGMGASAGLSGGARAQSPDDGPLDMAGAVQAAVRTHPSVRGAGQQVRQAEESVEAARAGYKPQITGGIENQYSGYRNSSYDSRRVYTAKVTGSQMLYDFGKVAGAVDQARSDVRAGEAQAQMAVDAVSLNTAQAWVDAHLQQSLVGIAREELAAIRSIAALVAERAAKGATTRSDVEQARSRVEVMRSQMLGAEAEALRASLTLMNLTGRAAPVAIVGDIPDVLRDGACRASATAETAAVRQAAARRDAARAGLDVAKAQRLPTVTLDGSVGYALTDGSRLYGQYRTTGQVGLNLSMPLYQGGATRARERGALYALRAYEDAVEQARLEMRQGFAEAKAQADGWAERAPVLQRRLQSIDATRGLYRQQYLLLGTRSLLDLLNSEQEYYSARVEQAQGTHSQYRLAVQCLYYSDRLRGTFGLADAAPRADAPMTAGSEE